MAKTTQKKPKTQQKVTKITIGDEVCVNWKDAGASPGWSETPIGLYSITSTGYLIKDSERYITLASDIGVSGFKIGRQQSIPKGCIDRMTVLRRGAFTLAVKDNERN